MYFVDPEKKRSGMIEIWWSVKIIFMKYHNLSVLALSLEHVAHVQAGLLKSECWQHSDSYAGSNT